MIKKRIFKPSDMFCPVPSVMVTCGTMENSNIITVAWTGIVNSEPPYVYISVRKSRYSHDIIEKSGEFIINFGTEDTCKQMDYCGVKSGRDVDKFKETGLHKMKGDKVSCPLIVESPVNLECKVIEKHEYPSHDMFLGEIVSIHVNEDIINEDDKIDFLRANLVSYVHGEYMGHRKTPVGFFGYSVARPKILKKRSKEAHDRRVLAKGTVGKHSQGKKPQEKVTTIKTSNKKSNGKKK